MLLQILGAALVVALVFTLFIRPGATLAILLAVGVVVMAVVVSWNDIEQVRTQRAAQTASSQQNVTAQANTTAPQPTPAHSGT
ncbi:MAG TPA: hypothetical protein VME45_11450 [Stellaceae bacterium]|nr:hypothetical protein [Stellaceae bacterium]